MKKTWKTFSLVAAAATALLLTSCGTGGKASTSDGGSAAAAGASRDLNFAVVVHDNPDGSFWNVVKRGAEDAGKQYGVKVTVTGNQEGSEQAKLIQSALAKKPDGLVVSMANPDALQSALQQAKSEKVPFVTINSGAEKSAEFGAIGHVGQDETVAGQAAGKRMKDAGVHKLLCVVHEAGNIGLQQRCDGAKEAFGDSFETVQVDLNNPQGIQSTIKSKLLGDTSIDGILSLNPAVTTAVLAGIKDAGSKAKLGSFDIDTNVLKSIQSGDVLFTVDQQQYLQGYLPIAMLVLYHDNLNTVGGGHPVLTGPAFITKDNVQAIEKLIAKGTR